MYIEFINNGLRCIDQNKIHFMDLYIFSGGSIRKTIII